MRIGEMRRATAETDVALEIDLDGTGKADIDTGVGFLNHMLTLLAKHARFDLSVSCRGDVEVDDHHSVEDIGICLGDAFRQALGERRGVNRYASICLPMDEALVLVAVDLSGRGLLCYDLSLPNEKIGAFDSELVEEFMIAFARRGNLTLHLKKISGSNGHHIAEAAFKGLGRALRQAVAIDPDAEDEIPSTKGVLE